MRLLGTDFRSFSVSARQVKAYFLRSAWLLLSSAWVKWRSQACSAPWTDHIALHFVQKPFWRCLQRCGNARWLAHRYSWSDSIRLVSCLESRQLLSLWTQAPFWPCAFLVSDLNYFFSGTLHIYSLRFRCRWTARPVTLFGAAQLPDAVGHA